LSPNYRQQAIGMRKPVERGVRSHHADVRRGSTLDE
jgi:hypothetical protein